MLDNNRIPLPPQAGDGRAVVLPDSRQVTLVGGTGAGKTRFMMEMIRLCGRRAFLLSAIGCDYPEKEESILPGSIDVQFRSLVKRSSYFKEEAVTELDKLVCMLFDDEFEYLLQKKFDMLAGVHVNFEPTRLDHLKQLWENIYPGNTIVRSAGRLMFSTSAGDDLIPFSRLSRGETSVLYFIAGVLYAPASSVIFIDSPSLMIHPSVVNHLWNSLEALRPDCRFVYDTVDVDFIASRTENVCVWIKSYDAARKEWAYEVLPPAEISEEMLVSLIGARKPVMFVEGDAMHSIDIKLYTLVFKDYSVRPLGSCTKVIETVRSFGDLQSLHHLDSHGIVDRDRRSDEEVAYLRRKNILVPEVAEVENLFLLPEVISVMARRNGRSESQVVSKVRRKVMKMFAAQYDKQALQHVRHSVKREVECRIDARFSCITAMETHLRSLLLNLKPRQHYEQLLGEFRRMVREDDYYGVLKVFNHKPMLSDCGVDRLLGYDSKDEYIAGVLAALKGSDSDSVLLRNAVRRCFGLDDEGCYTREMLEAMSQNSAKQGQQVKKSKQKVVSRNVNRKTGNKNSRNKNKNKNKRKRTRRYEET